MSSDRGLFQVASQGDQSGYANCGTVSTTVWLPTGSERSTFNESDSGEESEACGPSGSQKDWAPTEKNNDPAVTFLTSSTCPVWGLRIPDA